MKTAFVVTYFETWHAAVPINTVPINSCLQGQSGICYSPSRSS